MRIKSRLHHFFNVAIILLVGASASTAQVPQLLNYQGRIAVNGTNFTGTGQFKFALIGTSTNAAAQATASGTVSFGFLVNIAVNNGGSGYSTPPVVTITDSTGAGASATAQISGGVVTNIVVTSAGYGYSASPVVTIAAPPQQNVSTSFWSNDGTSNAGGQPATSVPLPVTRGLYSVLLGDTTLSNMATLSASVFANPGVWLRVWFNDGITEFQQLTPDQRLAAVAYAIMAGTVPDGSITAGKIAAGAVGSSQLAPNLTIPGTLTVSNLVVNGTPLVNTSTNFQLPSGTNIQTYAGSYYFITNALSPNIILPRYANVGDTIHVRIPNNSWGSTFNIQQNTGQRIVWWNYSSGLYGPIVCSADGTKIATLAGSQAILLSTNSAGSWTLQPPMEPWPTPQSIGAIQISSDGSHVFISAYFPYSQGVLISKDQGQSWALNTNFPTAGYIACSTNGMKVAAVTGVGVFTSTDSGSNWILQANAPTNANWQSIASSADGTKLVALANQYRPNGGIYTSGNSGLTWTYQTSAPTNISWEFVASSADGQKLAVTAYDSTFGGIYTSINSGSTWIHQTNAPGLYWQNIASSSDGTKLAATLNWNGSMGGVYTSVNSGLSWMPQTNGLPYQAYCYSIASSADGLKLVGCFSDGKTYLSVDMGNTWSPITSVPAFPIQTLAAVSSLGTSGGATFNNLNNGELILVYLGNGMFAIADSNSLNGY